MDKHDSVVTSPKFIWGASMSVSLGDHNDGKHCIETFGKPSDVSLESKLEFKRFKMFASKQPWPPSRLFENPRVKQRSLYDHPNNARVYHGIPHKVQ